MKVCYWNVQNGSRVDDIIGSCERLRDDYGIDMFCLQEVPDLPDAPGTPASLAVSDALGLEGHAYNQTRKPPAAHPLKRYGTAIISASGLVDPQTTVLRSDSLAYMSPGKDSRRLLMTAATEEDPDMEIGVAHLSFVLPGRIGRAGLRTERQTLLRGLSNTKVFGGDLNCPPTDPLDADLAANGFRPVEAEGVTFRSRHELAGMAMQRSLDRVFVAPDIEARAVLGDFGPSDHRQVIVETSPSPVTEEFIGVFPMQP